MMIEEFAVKLEEMRAIIADKVSDLEEDPKWGTADQREEIVTALHEVGVQIEALEEILQEEADEEEEEDSEEG